VKSSLQCATEIINLIEKKNRWAVAVGSAGMDSCHGSLSD